MKKSLLIMFFFIMSCLNSTQKLFNRVTEKPMTLNADSIVNIMCKGELVSKEYYAQKSIKRLKIYNDSLAIEYYTYYYGLRILGVDLFENQCNRCHSWYPDFKNEHDYAKLDSITYFTLFKKDPTHLNIGLSFTELLSIKEYLKIPNSQSKFDK